MTLFDGDLDETHRVVLNEDDDPHVLVMQVYENDTLIHQELVGYPSKLELWKARAQEVVDNPEQRRLPA